MLASDKHTRLLRTIVNYTRKKFYNIDAFSQSASESLRNYRLRRYLSSAMEITALC
jgi:hypothetical protein